MRSVGDLTAEARIRDAALARFAESGVAGAPLRSIAADAGVSAALVLHHFGSKDGLVAAVDDHVMAFLAAVLDDFVEQAGGASATEPFGRLAEQPDIATYVARSLIEGGAAGSSLFDRLFDLSETSLASLREAGALRGDLDDPEMAALVLLAADLGVMLLRDHITRRLGMDPLSPDGLDRWARTELDVFTHGIFVAKEGGGADEADHIDGR